MNSAASVSEAPQVIQPDEAMSFDQFWHNNGGNNESPYSLGNKFLNFFTGHVSRAKDQYETYLNNLNARNEAKAAQSAQAYDEFMSNTAYSRGFADLQRSGYNPYLLINSGSSPASSTGSASKPEYSYSKPGIKDTQSNSKTRDLALIALAIAKIAALM